MIILQPDSLHPFKVGNRVICISNYYIDSWRIEIGSVFTIAVAKTYYNPSHGLWNSVVILAEGLGYEIPARVFEIYTPLDIISRRIDKLKNSQAI